MKKKKEGIGTKMRKLVQLSIFLSNVKVSRYSDKSWKRNIIPIIREHEQLEKEINDFYNSL